MIRAIRRSMGRARDAVKDNLLPGRVPAIPEDLAGWMSYEQFERNLTRLPETEIHWTTCDTTGQIFAKLLTHRYAGTPKSELQRLWDERRDLVVAAGGAPPSEIGSLALRVEMLDNMMEFHLAPPCGCPSLIALRAMGQA